MRVVRMSGAVGMVALLLLVALMILARGAAAVGFPDMPMGPGGMPPMNARFGHQRRDRVGRAPGTGGFGGGMHAPPGFNGGPGLGGGDMTMPSDKYDGSGLGYESMDPSLMAQRRHNGALSVDDIKAMLPKDEQEYTRPSDDPSDGEYIGATGWVRTGKFRKEGDPEPRRIPEDQRQAGPDDMMDGTKGFKDFGEDATMDERFTGMTAKPSKNKKKKSGDEPDVGADGRPVAEVDTAKCFRQAIRVCPMRLMQDDFSAFASCIVTKREQMEGSCEGWAETHGDCAPEMVKHCRRMDPPETTKCMIDKKTKLDPLCSKSEFFRAMEEGFSQMEERMKKSTKIFSAAAAGESAAFEQENGPGMGGDFGFDGAAAEGRADERPIEDL